MPFRRVPRPPLADFINSIKGIGKKNQNSKEHFTPEEKAKIQKDARAEVARTIRGSDERTRLGMYNIDTSGADTPGPINRGLGAISRWLGKRKEEKNSD